MLMIFETIDCDEDQQITEYRKNEAAAQIVRQLGLTQQHRARRQRRRQPGQHQKLRGQKRPGQIAEPDERQMQCIAFVVFKQIADPPRIQMKIHRTDCEQTYGKKRRTDDLILYREINGPAQRDRKTCHDAAEINA